MAKDLLRAIANNGAGAVATSGVSDSGNHLCLCHPNEFVPNVDDMFVGIRII